MECVFVFDRGNEAGEAASGWDINFRRNGFSVLSLTELCSANL